jgi:hypothetical protein
VVLGCLQIALIAIVLAIDPSETRRKLGDAQTAPSAERPSGEPNGGPNP